MLSQGFNVGDLVEVLELDELDGSTVRITAVLHAISIPTWSLIERLELAYRATAE